MITLSTNWQEITNKFIGSSYGNVYAVLRAKYESQDAETNQTKGIQIQIAEYYTGNTITCGVWHFKGWVNGFGYIADAEHYGNYTFGNGTNFLTDGNKSQKSLSDKINITHNSDGTKTIKMGVYGAFTSWGWEASSGDIEVALPTIDRSAPTVTATVTPISATQISVSATSNVASADFKAYIDGSTTGVALTVASNGLSASGTLTVSEGTHTVYVSAKKNSNNVVGSSSSVSVTTKVPVVNFSVTNITTDSITISATSDVATTAWGFSSNGGTSYATPTVSTATTTQSYTFTGLAINTDYSIKVRVQNPDNNLYGVSATSTARTQGGILHVKVGSTWKDALAYVKVGNSWKQAIVYTKVGNSWRIGT